MFGNPILAARGQRDRGDPAHVRRRRVDSTASAIGPGAQGTGAGHHGAKVRRPPRPAPGFGEAIEGEGL